MVHKIKIDEKRLFDVHYRILWLFDYKPQGINELINLNEYEKYL